MRSLLLGSQSLYQFLQEQQPAQSRRHSASWAMRRAKSVRLRHRTQLGRREQAMINALAGREMLTVPPASR